MKSGSDLLICKMKKLTTQFSPSQLKGCALCSGGIGRLPVGALEMRLQDGDGVCDPSTLRSAVEQSAI